MRRGPQMRRLACPAQPREPADGMRRPMPQRGSWVSQPRSTQLLAPPQWATSATAPLSVAPPMQFLRSIPEVHGLRITAQPPLIADWAYSHPVSSSATAVATQLRAWLSADTPPTSRTSGAPRFTLLSRRTLSMNILGC